MWYPNFTEKLKKVRVTQNKCICFCLKLGKRHLISEEDFKRINWLPADQRVDQSLNFAVFIYVNNVCTSYMKDVFEYIS